MHFSLATCDSYIARFSLLGNPGELESVGEFTKVEGRKQSSAWCRGLIRAQSSIMPRGNGA